MRSFGAILIAAALCSPLTGFAAAADSPACALLTNDEAIRALNGAADMKDGGAPKNGYSDCAWIRTGATLSLLFWSRERFPEGAPGAAEYYAGLAARSLQRRLPVTQITDLGDQAMIIDESGGGLLASTILVLKAGQVIQMSQRGVTRTEAMAAARAVTGRLLADESMAGPVDVDPPETPAPEPEPPPATEPTAPASPPPGPTPQPASPGPSARRSDTAACALLTAPAIQKALEVRNAETSGGEVQGPGDTTCSWRISGRRAYIAINLVEGEAITAAAADANAYFGQLDAPQPGNGIERLGGVGEAAYLAVTGTGDAASYSFSILSNGKVAFLDISGVSRPAAIRLAQAVAAAM